MAAFSQFTPRFRFKIVKLDRRFIKRRWPKAQKDPLKRIGALVRRTAINTIRSPGKKGRPSKPGRPPKTRAKDAPLKKIFYDLVPHRAFFSNVIVGPIVWPRKSGAGPVTAIHEHGLVGMGKNFIRDERAWKNSLKRGQGSGMRGISKKQSRAFRRKMRQEREEGLTRSQRTKQKGTWAVARVKYPKRPFMQPAMIKVKDKYPGFWKDAFGK